MSSITREVGEYDALIATIPWTAQEIADAHPLLREQRFAVAMEFYIKAFRQFAPGDLFVRRWAGSVMSTIRELVTEVDVARVASESCATVDRPVSQASED